jgi:hypothetical protein
MKYFYLLLCLLILIQFNATAQRNFKPGYIVTLKGDTTKGFIDYKEWNQNPGDITFKTTEQATTQQYSPNNIKAFGVDQLDHYQKYTGPITKGAVDLADLSSGIDTSFVTDNIFLRIVSGGKNVTLYSYRDMIKTRFFIADGKSSPVELRRYVYLDNKQVNKIREFNFYTQQLLALGIKYAPGNEELAAKIDKTPYRSSDIEAVVLQLNGNADIYKVKNSAGGSSSQFFIGVGIDVSKASFTGTQGFSYPDNIFYAKTKAQSAGPLIAGGMDFYFNKNVKKVFFRAEVNLTMNKLHASYRSSVVDYINKMEREDEVSFNQIALAFNPQLVYNIYNKNNFKFFVAGGLQLNFSVFSNRHYYVYNYLNGTLDNRQDRQGLYSYRAMTSTLTAKAGVTLANKFNIYLGYGAPVSMINNPNYGIDISYYRIGVNYLLGIK